MSSPALRTERLLLRQWEPADVEPWAALNADPEVMEHFPAPLSVAESAAFVDRVSAELASRGWGWFAVEVDGGARFVGSVALVPVSFDAPFGPAVEVGWRFARAHWGNGYATEGARALLRYAFDVLALPAVVSFTATSNLASQAVMLRLGMGRDPHHPTFEHPKLPPGHRLRPHVLYRIDASAFAAQAAP